MINIQQRLFELQDTEYKAFHAKLMPTVSLDVIIGVRTPALRKLAKELWRELPGDDVQSFLETLPHEYYEENNLHGFFIESIKDYEDCVRALDAFLPYVDNWATCDLMSPKVLGKYPAKLLEKVRLWLADSHPYTVRFAIGMLMRFYLDKEFDIAYPEMVAGVQSEEYYVNMMRAWYFATALAKQYEAVLPYIEENRLDVWTHNKAIQKAVESLRITPEQKSYLKGLKRKAMC